MGSIGCQADKTLEAIEAFIGLLKNMPLNQTRFDSALTSLLSNYRTNPITSSAIPRFVYDIHALGLADDPRITRYDKIKASTMADLKAFYLHKIKTRPIFFSIVGDSTKIDLLSLERFGKVIQINKNQLFNR